jgi:hypothetical protein
MKLIPALLSCLILAATGCDRRDPPGRYQVVSGRVRVNEKDESMIIKIDTVTGATWGYSKLDYPAKVFDQDAPNDMSTSAEGWAPLSDKPPSLQGLRDGYWKMKNRQTPAR